MFFGNVSKPLIEIPTQLDLIYLILACVGLLIVLACIGSYLFGYGRSLQDRVQEIKAFGADMRISVITVCILVGIALVVPLYGKVSMIRCRRLINQGNNWKQIKKQ